MVDRPRRILRDLVLGSVSRKVMSIMESEQWLLPSVIADRQQDRARQAFIDACEFFPSYRGRLETFGFSGNLVHPAFEWPEIPPLKRSELNGSPGLARVNRAYAWRITGGSTGPALRIPLGREAYCWYMAGQWRGLQWWGIGLGERGVILLPSGGTSRIRALAGSAKDWALNWLRLPADDTFDQRVESIFAEIQRHRPAFIYGYPSALARLARHLVRRGRSADFAPRLIVTTGEHLYAFQRRLIEGAFGSPVAEEYGCSEVGSIAFQCPAGRLHITAESVLVETIRAGISSPPGEPGTVLVTGLRNPLIPLIRYELGDLAALEPDPCSCGRGLPVIRILGREDEQLVQDGRSIPAQEVVERLMTFVRGAEQTPNVRLVQRHPSDFSLQVERSDFPYVDIAGVEKVGMQLGYRVVVESVDQIPRTPLGKVRSLECGPHREHPDG